MTTETRTDRPQIDTSRMNIDDHAYVTPAPRAPRSGHRNDRPSERRDFDQDLQHSRDDPAIVMIGRPRDDILAEIRPSYWSAFPETTSTSLTPRVRTSLTPRVRSLTPRVRTSLTPRVRTSLNPRARTSLTPRSPRTRTSPTSLGTRTRTSPRKREHARTRHLQCSLDDQLQRRFPVSQFLQSRSRSRPTWPNFDTLDWPRLQLHDAGSLVYAYTDIPSMAWSAMRTPRSTTATTPWRRIASIR